MATPDMSDCITNGVRVGATAYYLPDQSEPDHRDYKFGYTIVVANNNKQAVQLVSRHWIIIDAYGRREEAEGPGVVGQTPRIEPNTAFRYQSYCPLRTPWGTMEGTYTMQFDNGEKFEVKIARFYLRVPKEG